VADTAEISGGKEGCRRAGTAGASDGNMVDEEGGVE
jgi:hypothetical protein